MPAVGQFGCCASEMPLKGKLWEFSQLEEKSEFPFPYKVTLTKYASLNSSPVSSLKSVAPELPTGTNSIAFPNHVRS